MPAGFCSHQRMLTLHDFTHRGRLKATKTVSAWVRTHTQPATTRSRLDASWVMQTLSCFNKPTVGLWGNKAKAKSVTGLAISWVTDEFIREVHSRGSLGKSCSMHLAVLSHTNAHTHWCRKHPDSCRHQSPLWHTTSSAVSHLCSLVDRQPEARRHEMSGSNDIIIRRQRGPSCLMDGTLHSPPDLASSHLKWTLSRYFIK